MKIARFFSILFACIGVVLLIGSMVFLLWNRNAPVRIRELPQEAMACSDAFAQALNDGDLEAAAQMMYGQPDLGVEGIPADPESALVWQEFVSTISFEYIGECQVADSALIRTASITTRDIATAMGKLPERAQALVDQRIASAESLTEVYDESGSFREELVPEILEQALEQLLAQDAETRTREVTVKLIKRNGSWWVVPDQRLLQILSGLS